MKDKAAKKQAPSVEGVVEVPNEISLSEKQKSELAEVDRKSAMTKIGIGDLSIQIEMFIERRRQAIEEIRRIEQEYAGKVTKFATALGIEVDANPAETGERWNFDPQMMKFTRIKVEKQPA